MITRLALSILLMSTSCLLVAQDSYSNGTALLGIRLRPVPLDVLEQVGLDPGQGTMVTGVFPGTAADDMGLQPGDVIINVNGTDTDSRRDVRTTVIDHNAGDDAQVTVLRAGSSDPITLEGKFSEMPEWLEKRFVPRVPHMTERWENHVVERQLAQLAQREEALHELEQAVSELEQQQEAAQRAINESLYAPLTFDAARKPLALSPSLNAWIFQYKWTFSTSAAKESACNDSSLVHF